VVQDLSPFLKQDNYAGLVRVWGTTAVLGDFFIRTMEVVFT